MHEEVEPLKLHAVCSISRLFVEFVDNAQRNCVAFIAQKTLLRHTAACSLYCTSFVVAVVVC